MIFAKDLPIAEVLVTLGDSFSYYPVFSHALGNNVNAAIMLSTFMRWQGRQKNREGWIYKSAKDISAETGLTQAQQETAIKHLKKLNLLKDENRGTPCTKHFLFDWPAVTKLVNDYRQGQEDAAPPVPDKLLNSSLPEPLLKTMCKLFDEVYKAQTNGIGFEWGGNDKQISGKHLRNMKNLRDALQRSCISKKEQVARARNNGELPEDFQPAVSELDVLNASKFFFDYLPDYHRTRNLTPARLYSEYSTIIADVTAKHKQQHSTPGTGNRRAAASASVAADSI